jgi:hypothetical protein
MKELYLYRRKMLDTCVRVKVDVLRVFTPLIRQDEALHNPFPGSSQTPHHILAHLRNVQSHVFLPLICRFALAEKDEDGAPLCPYSEPTYQADEPAEGLLAEFARCYQKGLDCVENLPQEAWNRTLRHPRAGVRTLQWWVERSLAHTQCHLSELKAIGLS